MVKIVTDPNSSIAYDGTTNSINAKYYNSNAPKKKFVHNKQKELVENLSQEALEDEVRDWNEEYRLTQEGDSVDQKKEQTLLKQRKEQTLLKQRKGLSTKMFAYFVEQNRQSNDVHSLKGKVKGMLNYMKEKDLKRILSQVSGITIRDDMDEEEAQRQLEDPEVFRTYKKTVEQYEKKHTDAYQKQRLYNIVKRAYQQQIVFHGQQQGKIKSTDVDGQACEKILDLADFFSRKNGDIQKNEEIPSRTYVPNGQESDVGLHVDTGIADGGVEIKDTVKILDDGELHNTLFNSKLVVDEHGNSYTSSVKILYTLLKELHVFPKQEMKVLERFVEFVDAMDSQYYDIAGMDYDVSHKTIAGLHRRLPIKFIWDYFKEDPRRTGFEILDDNFFKKHKKVQISHWDDKNNKNINKLARLQWISNKQKSANETGKKEIDLLSKGEKFLRMGDHQFIVDMGGTLTNGPQVASHYEYDFMRVYPNGDLYMYAKDGLPKELLGQDTVDNKFFVRRFSNKKELEKFLDNFEYDSLGKTEQKDTSFVKDVIVQQYIIMEDMKQKNIQFKQTKVPYMSKDGKPVYGRLISFGLDPKGETVIFETREKGNKHWTNAMKWDTFVQGMTRAEQYLKENPTSKIRINSRPSKDKASQKSS